MVFVFNKKHDYLALKMKLKSKTHVLKKGYLYLFFASLIIGVLYGFRYIVMLKDNPWLNGYRKAILSSVIWFLIMFIPGLSIVDGF